MKKPLDVPKSFFRISVVASFLLSLYAAALWLVPAGTALWVLDTEVAVLPKLLAIAFLALAGSFGLSLFLWLGHEGGHGNLHPDAFTSNVIGIICSFPVAPQSAIGFSASHLDHHRVVNRDGDPNLAIYLPFTTYAERLFLSPRSATKKYDELTRRLLRGESLPFKSSMPLSREQLQRLARLNRAVQAAWVISLVSGLIMFPMELLIAYIIPGFLSRSYNGVRPYMEHSGLGDELGRDSRNRSSPVWTLLEAGNNFHQEHHLYPRVPCYKLPALHRYLKQRGFYDQASNIEPSFWGSFRHAGSSARLRKL